MKPRPVFKALKQDDFRLKQRGASPATVLVPQFEFSLRVPDTRDQ